ncbi:hypothetical protein [Reichenbachiella agariperforans]|nr:hypothetical protein [Reichenbachiella agariperforans]
MLVSELAEVKAKYLSATQFFESHHQKLNIILAKTPIDYLDPGDVLLTA